MNLIDYFESDPERYIPGKVVAEAIGVAERELRDKVKALNQNLLAIGSKKIIVSNNGKPSGYCFTGDLEKIARYRNQQNALACHINDNVIIAEAMLKRLRLTVPPKRNIAIDLFML